MSCSKLLPPLLALVVGLASAAPGEREVKRVELRDYQDMEKLFQRLDYTPESWQAGVREVPRCYITDIPERWRKQTVKQISVLTKKRLFFRALAPLVLHANELILVDRTRLQSVAMKLESGATIEAEDRKWVQALAVRYGVASDSDVAIDSSLLDALLARVDIVPVSLALSQAAEESGWGTSRFAAEGNALFGQWSWGKQAMKPEQRQKALGDYGVAAFETPLKSVLAYMYNLNTHATYEPLRAKRAALRKAGQAISGRALATTLTHYSQRGEAYVDSLLTLMTVNRLDPTDTAYLGNGPTIFMVPVTEGATGAGAGS